MLDVLAGVLGALSLVSVPAAVYLAIRLDSSRREQLAACDLRAKERDEYERTVDERDAAIRDATQAKTVADAATKRAELAERTLADLLGEKDDDAAEAVHDAADPADALDGVLQASARTDDAAPTGPGDGAAAAGAVRSP